MGRRWWRDASREWVRKSDGLWMGELTLMMMKVFKRLFKVLQGKMQDPVWPALWISSTRLL